MFNHLAAQSRFIALAAVLVTGAHALANEPVSIRLASDTDAEKSTAQQLKRLMAEYDLSRWTFTNSVLIDEKAIPHSHPVLTLHARHRKDDELLLSTYVHEQLHWFVAQHKEAAQATVRELRAIYPKIPVGFPEGSNDEDGNYEHLIVIYLEYRADQRLMGELKAREVMRFWGDDHYTWLYREVLKNPEKVGSVLKANALIPK